MSKRSLYGCLFIYMPQNMRRNLYKKIIAYETHSFSCVSFSIEPFKNTCWEVFVRNNCTCDFVFGWDHIDCRVEITFKHPKC